MDDTKNKLRRLLKKSAWKYRLLELIVNLLLLWQAAVDYWYYINFNFLFARRAFIKRTTERATVKAHWVRRQVEKPHRLAFTMLAIILLAGMFVAPSQMQALYWALSWGVILSAFVMIQSMIRVARSLTKIRN